MDWTVGKNGRIGIVGRMMQTGQSVLVHDVTKDQDYLPSHHETHSELAVPMKLGREIVGIINVEDSDYHAFDEDTISALSSLAAQAAIAIQNAQLYERMQKRAVALAALHEASRAITQSLNVDQVLATIVEQAFMLASVGETKAHLAAVSLAKDGKLNFVATYPPERLPALQMIVNDVDLEQEEGIGFTGRVAKLGRPLRLPNVAQSKDYILFDPTIHSSLAVPINVGQEVRGVITIEHQQFGAFNEEDEQVLTALAMQAALALQNAQEFQETRVLQKVSASLAGVLEVEDILKVVMKAALELTDTTSGSIIFWDEKQKRYYPSYTTQGKSLISYQTSARPQAGYTWQILQENRSIVIADTLTDPKVNPTQFPKGRLCHVGVPLPSTVAPPGVLWVHGLRSQQFSEHQVTVLETLANAASVALEKAWQYEELKKAKGLVGARTALAWMGMASSAWRHSIEGHATNIKAAVTLLRSQIQQAVKDPLAAANIQAKLDIIYAQAVQVHERRITVPLGTEESTQRVVMNDLIHERLLQLWQDEPYNKIDGPFLEMATTPNLAVWASPEWLRLALDLLVDNAVEAMQRSAVRRLTVTTQQMDDTIEIAIRDTGPGIDPKLLPQLFTERTEQPQREGHLGRGLLMVQAIVQTYHGDIDVGETGPNGTTMVLSLPLSPEA
jgi:GAF domain-containing protein